jgi:MFS family permease
MLVTCTNSIIAMTFKEEKAIYMGYVESSISVGLIFGPPMGSLIYT